MQVRLPSSACSAFDGFGREMIGVVTGQRPVGSTEMEVTMSVWPLKTSDSATGNGFSSSSFGSFGINDSGPTWWAPFLLAMYRSRHRPLVAFCVCKKREEKKEGTGRCQPYASAWS